MLLTASPASVFEWGESDPSSQASQQTEMEASYGEKKREKRISSTHLSQKPIIYKVNNEDLRTKQQELKGEVIISIIRVYLNP